MRASLLAISALVLATLVACNAGAPASPVSSASATRTPAPSAAAEPTPLSSASITPIVEPGFSIYLLAENVPPERLAILSHLQLEDEPILSMHDIAAYAREAHELMLTDSGYERIRSLSVPTTGIAFAVCVDGEPVYGGAFWPGYSSQSFDGVVIDPIRATKEHPVVQIQLGYPGPAFFRGDDPRSNPRILRALEQAGKLR